MQQSYQSPFPRLAPRRLPPKTNPVRRLAIWFGVIAGAIAALAIGLYIYMKLAPQHTILVDNANAVSVSLVIDGDRVQIGPHSSAALRVGDGVIAIHASGPGLDERTTIEMPASGWNTRGRTGLYNVGGAGHLAIVTVTYGSVFDAPPTQFLGRDKHTHLLPLDVAGGIDDSFPAQIESSGIGGVVRHVCHVDGERFKCAGSNASDAR